MPFQRARKHGPMGWSWLVDALERASGKNTVIDDRPLENQTLERSAVEHSPPDAMPVAVEFLRMLESQQRFRLSVTRLLAKIGRWGLTSVMPNKGSGGEGDPITRLLQSPANVDVVSRLAKLRIK